MIWFQHFNGINADLYRKPMVSHFGASRWLHFCRHFESDSVALTSQARCIANLFSNTRTTVGKQGGELSFMLHEAFDILELDGPLEWRLQTRVGKGGVGKFYRLALQASLPERGCTWNGHLIWKCGSY